MSKPSRAIHRALAPASLALWAAFAASGCATIIHGTQQEVSITSNPPGADGIVEPDGFRFVTPATVKLRRKQNYTVHLELSGYQPQNAYLYRVLSPALHGNLLLGGIIGASEDIDDGAAFELTPDPLQVILEPNNKQWSAEAASPPPAAPEIRPAASSPVTP